MHAFRGNAFPVSSFSAASIAIGITAFSGGLTPSVALAFGHGETPGLAHFVRAPRTVILSLVGNADLPSRVLGRASVPGDRALVVSESAPSRSAWSRSVLWTPQTVLAFYEGRAGDTESVIRSRIADAAGSVLAYEGSLALVALSPRAAHLLGSDARVFLSPVSTEGFDTGAKAATFRPSVTKQTRVKSQPAQPVLEPESERLLATIRELSGEDTISVGGNESRINERGGNAGRTLAQKYMMERFAALGLETSLRCYSQGWNQGCNVEATLPGADRSKVVLFTAHLDSVNNKGADDDGSGSATLLEAARLFSGQGTPAKSIRFVAFDQEELGLVGSKAYVAALTTGVGANERVVADFQMDMTGYDSDGDNAIHAMDCDRADSKPLTAALRDANVQLRIGLKIVDACTNRSDHASFWNKGIPATIVSENFFGGDENSCYHQKCDTIALLNVPYMTKVAKLITNAGWRYANARD